MALTRNVPMVMPISKLIVDKAFKKFRKKKMYENEHPVYENA
jgi:hypothetical protein